MTRPTLEKYKGSKTRHICPNCGKREFARYLDGETGEYFADYVGICNRANKCGYHYPPKQFFADNPHLKNRADDWRKSEAWKTKLPTMPAPTVQPEQIFFPDEIFRQSLNEKALAKNSFFQFMAKHPKIGEAKALDLAQRFKIGTSSKWRAGACVFWIIDRSGSVCGGQVKTFDNSGHTTATNWAHSILIFDLKKTGATVPDWLKKYDEHAAKFPCIWGLWQLETEPIEKPIALVEAPKTAVLMTAICPNSIWLAVGSLSYLTAERMQDLRGRKIVLFPDLGSPNQQGKTPFDLWSEKAARLAKAGFQISVSNLLERKCTPADRAEGLDIADYFFDKSQPEPAEKKPKSSRETAEKQSFQFEINEFGYPAFWDKPAVETRAAA